MSLNIQQRIEREIVAAATKGLLAQGFSISVFDGEETVLRESRDQTAILAAFSTDEDYFYAHAEDGRRIGFVRFVYGNGEDVICDNSLGLEKALVAAEKVAEFWGN